MTQKISKKLFFVLFLFWESRFELKFVLIIRQQEEENFLGHLSIETITFHRNTFIHVLPTLYPSVRSNESVCVRVCSEQVCEDLVQVKESEREEEKERERAHQFTSNFYCTFFLEASEKGKLAICIQHIHAMKRGIWTKSFCYRFRDFAIKSGCCCCHGFAQNKKGVKCLS